MDLASIKSYQRTMASVQLPIFHFLETGFWDPHSVPGWQEFDISEQQVRRACRQVATELKRPFIRCGTNVEYFHYVPDTTKPRDGWGNYPHKRVEFDKPRFSNGFIEVPKRKYLVGHIAPLTLAASKDGHIVLDRSGATLWSFYVRDQKLWDDYYQFVLNDPDCRKARKLTS